MSTFPIDLDLAALAKALKPELDKLVVSPAPVPAPTGTFWVYQNGQFNWESDYSWDAKIDYANKIGKPGGSCISVAITGKWGGFQPYAQGKRFDTGPFKYLIYSVKPTLPNAIFATAFAAINDVADGSAVIVAGPGITKYGPVPQVGAWGAYKVPLADFGLTNPLIQKFTIAAGAGYAPDLYYVDNVGFTP